MEIVKILVSSLQPSIVKIVVSELTIAPAPSTAKGITAYAGGGQANATVISKNFNRVDTVATNDDSCKTDAALAGNVREIYNSSDNDLKLYPAIGERFKNDITLLDINTPITIGSKNGLRLICYQGETGIYTYY